MEDTKQWFYSKTIWGALIAVGSSALQIKGFQLGIGDQSTVADAAVSIAGALGGLLAVYGRMTASSAIKSS
jgi:hypothetical protein